MTTLTRSPTLSAALVAFVAFLAACGSPGSEAPAGEVPEVVEPTSQNAAGFRDVTTHEVAELVGDPEVLVVNVHIPYEGEIPGTDVHIPYDDLDPYLDRLPADQDAPILLYCLSGRMSEIAGEELAARGYTNVMHHVGGMVDWEAEGFELIHQEPGASR